MSKKAKHAKISLDTVRLGEHLRKQAKKKDDAHNAATLEPDHCDLVTAHPPHGDEEPDSRPDRP